MLKPGIASLLLLACAGATSVAGAQERAANQYPSRAIKVIVPYAPGGSTDKIARLLTEQLSAKLNQTITVENKPGANNIVGANALLASAPDGYTLMLASNGLLTMAPALIKKMPFDPATAFSLIGLVNQNPMVIATSTHGQNHDMRQVLERARANPGAVSYAVSGGLVPALSAAALQAKSNTKMLEVRYKGSASSMTDLMAGRVDLGFMGVSLAAPLVDEGKLVAIAVTSKERSSRLPKVPTLAESGVKDFETVVWNALIGPPGMPANIITTLNRALDQIYNDPAFKKTLQMNGEEPLRATPRELQDRVIRDIAAWKVIVKSGGIPMID